MDIQYFTNKEIQFLKTFMAMMAALPLCLIAGVFLLPDIDNRGEMIKLFSFISAGMLALAFVVWKKLAVMPPYYLSVHDGIVTIPDATFLGWDGGLIQIKHSEITRVVHEPKASGNNSNLVIGLPAHHAIASKNMVLGQMRFEQEDNGISLVICGLKKKDALRWKEVLDS